MEHGASLEHREVSSLEHILDEDFSAYLPQDLIPYVPKEASIYTHKLVSPHSSKYFQKPIIKSKIRVDATNISSQMLSREFIENFFQFITFPTTKIKISQIINQRNKSVGKENLFLQFKEEAKSVTECSLNCNIFTQVSKIGNSGIFASYNFDKHLPNLCMLFQKKIGEKNEILSKLSRHELGLIWKYKDPSNLLKSKCNLLLSIPQIGYLESIFPSNHNSQKPFNFGCKLSKPIGKNDLSISIKADDHLSFKTEISRRVSSSHTIFGSFGSINLSQPNLRLGVRHHISDSLSYSISFRVSENHFDAIIDIYIGGHEFCFPITFVNDQNSNIFECIFNILFIQVALIPIQKILSKKYSKLEESRNYQKKADEREHFEKMQILMSRVAASTARKEASKNGLVINKAVYGDLRSFTNNEIQSPMAIDVTTTLQAMVVNSSLICRTGKSKSMLLGFFSPSIKPDHNRLLVQYTFNNAQHEICLNDCEDIVLP